MRSASAGVMESYMRRFSQVSPLRVAKTITDADLGQQITRTCGLGFALVGQGTHADAPEVRPADMATIATPIDFLGVNYASHAIVRDDPPPPIMAARLSSENAPADGRIEGLYDALAPRQRESPPPTLPPPPPAPPPPPPPD